MDKDPRRPRSEDRDFLDRLSDLDRNLPVSGYAAESAASDADGEFAERRRSSAAAPRDPRPLLDLFPPVETDPAPADSGFQRVSSPPAGEAPAAGEPLSDEVFTEEELDARASARAFAGTAGLAAAFLLAMAAGATAAAYVFRADLAALIAAWQQTP
jgi:hypothetical protein